ncbi:hypothetical protein IGI37_003016 [Enterococcus sp. AZ194]
MELLMYPPFIRIKRVMSQPQPPLVATKLRIHASLVGAVYQVKQKKHKHHFTKKSD